MSVLSEHHKELNAEGVGKCSVPMWSGGGPAGFCDEPAYGMPLPREYIRDGYTGQRIYLDSGYDGYVPALACPCHGGPKKP